MKTTDRREFLTLAAASIAILVIPALGQTTAAPNQPAASCLAKRSLLMLNFGETSRSSLRSSLI
jgi:hypothetical protein